MKKSKPLSVVLASVLAASIMGPHKGFASAEEAQPSFFSIDRVGQIFTDISREVKQTINDIILKVTGAPSFLNIEPLDPSVVKLFDLDLIEDVFSEVTLDVQLGMKELVAIWASKGHLISPSAQLGIIKNAAGESAILDLSEKDLTFLETEILNLLIRLRGEGKLVAFVSTLVETLKTDPQFGHLVSAIKAEEKLKLLSTVDATIGSTASLRKFTKQSWKGLSAELANKLNKFEKDVNNQSRLSDNHFLAELANVANSGFYPAGNVKLLVNGPASFSLRDSAMAKAKESINMITWAVIDDKTGRELADLLIKKSKEGLSVRLIVDGQVSYRAGYKEQVERMEKNGVSVMRWFNPDAPFMGQHRKILIIDEALTIMGGMNPGDTYSHKAGEAKNLWLDTDVALQGEAAEQTQKLFATIWNKQIAQQKLSLKKITKVKKQTSVVADVQAMIVEHEPQASGDQHEILLTKMKAIRGAEKTVDIENAYVIVFPSLLNEIKAAVERGVRVRVLTNSSDSVDEPVVALPITRSAKMLADIGAEVYLRKGSTVHSKYMIVDERLFLIGSYNLHPRSERIEGETIVVFDQAKLAHEVTQAFEKNILPASANRLEKTQGFFLPINGSTLLPLRMFYDQL